MAAVYYDGAYRGTASERTALTGMRDKDAYIEIDTGAIFFYNEGTWLPFGEDETAALGVNNLRPILDLQDVDLDPEDSAGDPQPVKEPEEVV